MELSAVGYRAKECGWLGRRYVCWLHR